MAGKQNVYQRFYYSDVWETQDVVSSADYEDDLSAFFNYDKHGINIHINVTCPRLRIPETISHSNRTHTES